MIARVQAHPRWVSESMWASSIITQLPLRRGSNISIVAAVILAPSTSILCSPVNRLQATPFLLSVSKTSWASRRKGARYQPLPGCDQLVDALKRLPAVGRTQMEGDALLAAVMSIPGWKQLEQLPAQKVAFFTFALQRLAFDLQRLFPGFVLFCLDRTQPDRKRSRPQWLCILYIFAEAPTSPGPAPRLGRMC